MKANYLISIQGPTASGKTYTSVSIARYFNTEIISADSRQFYREMSIGTAKPSALESNEVKHHFIGEFSIFQPINSSDFGVIALDFINKFFLTKNILVLTGGSGLYIDAVLKGFNPIPDVDQSVRNQVVNEYQQYGLGQALEKLKIYDPEYFRKIDKKNPRRVLRALEICISTGKPYTYFLNLNKPARNFSIIKIGLLLSVDELYKRINIRCQEMLDLGLIEEVKTLYLHRHLTPLQTIGYQEFFDYLEGKGTLEFAKEKFMQHTRNYAKKQITWLKKDKDITWFDPSDTDKILRHISVRIS